MSDVDVMNQGPAGEHFGIAAYAAALGSGLLDEPVAGVGPGCVVEGTTKSDRVRTFELDPRTVRALRTWKVPGDSNRRARVCQKSAKQPPCAPLEGALTEETPGQAGK